VTAGTEQDRRVRLVELEAEKELAALGYDAGPILPLVREEAAKFPAFSATEIIAVLKAEHGESFKPRETTVQTRPADRTLDDFSEREKIDYVGKHGLEAFLKLVDQAGQKRRAEMQRKIRGF
jgi:hypothetical protein